MAHGEVHHDYHLVDPSPWPIVGSIGAFVMLIGAVFWMNEGYTGFWGLPVNGQPWIFVLGFVAACSTPWPDGGATSCANPSSRATTSRW